jgi:hypothetical protein
MSGIHLILAGLAIFGFLPLVIILYKKNRAKKILTTGLSANATVYDVQTVYGQPTEMVSYSFYAINNTTQFTGRLTIERGLYKPGDVLEIHYLPDNPKQNTMHGAWGSPVLVIFGVVIAAAVLFAVYKLNEMVEAGSI